jgi:hypothetical protein
MDELEKKIKAVLDREEKRIRESKKGASMINVEVKDYCDNCKDFTAETNTETIYGDNEVRAVCHTVTCKNKYKCEELYKHLKGEQRGDGD